jgi:hypothetical protein
MQYSRQQQVEGLTIILKSLEFTKKLYGRAMVIPVTYSHIYVPETKGNDVLYNIKKIKQSKKTVM